jgi:hypothetical protein
MCFQFNMLCLTLAWELIFIVRDGLGVKPLVMLLRDMLPLLPSYGRIAIYFECCIQESGISSASKNGQASAGLQWLSSEPYGL